MLVNVFLMGFALSLALLLVWFYLAIESKVSDRVLDVMLIVAVVSYFGCWAAAILLS